VTHVTQRTGTPASATETPVVAVLLPATMRQRVLSADAEAALATVAELRSPNGSGLTADELSELVAGATACVTGWGTPPIPESVLSENPRLGLIAHTAGSIRKLVPLAAVERGLRVCHAAAIIADAVAEFVIAQLLLSVRPLHLIDQDMKRGVDWLQIREQRMGQLLGARTVGVVGAGYVGRVVIRLLTAFGCRILVFDPLLTDAAAAELGVERSSLPDLFAASDLVTLHAPVLPETRGMIDAGLLRQLRDGAVFVNTARAVLVNEAALLKELQSGRISAALDVFDTEPLPLDSPFRTLPNVLLSPHAAGHSTDTYLQQGQAMVDEVRRFLNGDPLRFEVTPAMLATMA
jgi:phosphoglycerate dehydrogenase-like enzyme